MLIEKLMLILIIIIYHCVFILSLFNYGEFIHQAITNIFKDFINYLLFQGFRLSLMANL